MALNSKHRLAVAAILALSTASAMAADRTWTGAAGDSLFVTPGNWDAGVPTAADAVLVGPMPDESIIGLTGNVTRPVSSMTFLPTAGAYLVTGGGAGDILQLDGAGTALANDSAQRQTFSELTVQAGASQTWDGKASGFTFTQISLGSNRVVTFAGTGTTADTRNEIRGDVSGVLGTTSGITQSGSGVLFVAPAATLSFDGPTTVSGGTLLLGGSNVLPNASNLILSGGTLDIAGFDETAGKLTLAGNATINFGISNTADLVFDASQLETWGAFTLNIQNFDVGQDTLRIGTTAGGLDATQLAKIMFNGETAAQIDGNGFVTPIPEPSAALLLGIGAVGLGSFRRRRAVTA